VCRIPGAARSPALPKRHGFPSVAGEVDQVSSLLTTLRMLLQPARASGTDLVPVYEQAFARTILGNGTLALAFPRGRVALWAILKALDVNGDSEVILPAYTCETVPMAVKFAGAKCVYTDVEPGRYNSSLRDVANVVTERTKAIICQHTYGIAQPIEDWIEFANANRVLLIEDRCQLVKNGSQGGPTAALGSVAYFSTHFSKPFSTAQGGFAAFSDARLHTAVERVRAAFPYENDRRCSRSVALQSLLYSVAVRPSNRAVIASLFRWAQRAGLIRGTIAADEYGGVMPPNYLSRATNVHAVLGMKQLRLWHENCRHRHRLTRFYLDRLASLGVDVSSFTARDDDPVLLMVPVLAQNKGEVLRRAATKGLPIGTWFDRCPAHTHADTARRYDYRPDQCPNAERLISTEIHLLTAPWVTERQAGKAIRFIEKCARLTTTMN